MPGRTDYLRQPSAARLKAAMQALADFHLASEFALSATRSMGTSAGVQSRCDALAKMDGLVAKISRSMDGHPWVELNSRARRLLDMIQQYPARDQVLRQARFAASRTMPLQPCIRDIWHDHVLFTGDEVTGIIDFGAMNVDSVSGDVARLLGSLARNDVNQWAAGIEAYSRRRPLSQDEQLLIQAIDRSNVLLSGLNWLRWNYLEHREFEHTEKVLAHVDEAIFRLGHLADS